MGAHTEDSPDQECGYPYRKVAAGVPRYGQMTKTVLIVDDHPSFRLTARALLEAEGFEVVGEAENGKSALELARKLRPDVLLLDVQLPDLDGFEVADNLSRNGWSPAIVLTSSRDLSDFGSLVTQCGARGFVPKAELSAETLSALLE
jgi:DNA-binding NarL/FixJ family response regulator